LSDPASEVWYISVHTWVARGAVDDTEGCGSGKVPLSSNLAGEGTTRVSVAGSPALSPVIHDTYVVTGDDATVIILTISLGQDVNGSLLEYVREGSTSVCPSPSGDDTGRTVEILTGLGQVDGGDELVAGGGSGQTDYRDIVGESTGSIVRPTGVRGDGGNIKVSWASLTFSVLIVHTEYNLVGRSSRSDTVSSACKPGRGDKRSSTGVRAARFELEGRLPWVLSWTVDVTSSYDTSGTASRGDGQAKSENE